MDMDKYEEITSGPLTCIAIATQIYEGKTVGIGWTDEEGTHLDLVFKLGLDEKHGYFQRGIKKEDLFIGIIGHNFYGFNSDSIKEGTYIQEKLMLGDVTGDKLAELINGIIIELNKLKEELHEDVE